MSENTSSKPLEGLWISNEILSIEGINFTEKCILAKIHNLSQNNKDCSLSNRHFANIFDRSALYISQTISKLKRFQFIEQVSFDGRIRHLKINKEYA